MAKHETKSKESHEAEITTNHDEIRRWVEERGGRPARVRGTGEGKEDAGLLRIDMPDSPSEQELEPISWEQFFEKFEEKNLAFLYQDTAASGRKSYFSKLVSRDSEAAHR